MTAGLKNLESLEPMTSPDMKLVREALENAYEERDWLYSLIEDQTCSDLCDKTYEFQGCPSGTCAKVEGEKKFRETTEKIAQALAALDANAGAARVKVNGVSRMADNYRAILVGLSSEPTDD